MEGLSSTIAGVGSAIGRYFSVVSFIPSFFLVGFTFALIQSGAWSGDGAPDWAQAGTAFGHLGDLVVLILLSIAFGVAVHPIQFALVQFLEGYWGMGTFAQRLRAARMLHHSRRLDHLREHGGRADVAAQMLVDNRIEVERDELIRLFSLRDEGNRLRHGYPVNDDEDIMPTRLGNALRRYERLAGSQYNLDGVQVLRHVAVAAPQAHLDYLNDQRESLDLSVRMCVTSICAVAVAIAFLWHHGPWLGIALIPYVIAYISYRGAVVVAHEYGAAICTIIDLDRFALYESLRLPLPADTVAERSTNARLRRLLEHDDTVALKYKHPNAADRPGQTGAGSAPPAS